MRPGREEPGQLWGCHIWSQTQKTDKPSCDQEACEQFLSLFLQVPHFLGRGYPSMSLTQDNTEASLFPSLEK